MSIYDRNYMRGNPGFGRPEWALKAILVTLLAVFLIQNIFRHWMGSSFIETHFALTLYRLSEGWIHTLLTYGLLHSTDQALPWHLLFNCLMLYWFGKELETRMGSERFMEFFLLCVLAGGVLWSCFHFILGQTVAVVGASAGVFGVLYLFCRNRWDILMSFLFIPIQFTGKQLLWVLLGFQVFFLLFAELPGSAVATAHSAHLGGMLGAYIYERKLMHLSTLTAFFRRLTAGRATLHPPKWSERAKAAKSATQARFRVNTLNRPGMKKEVDRILDKINTEGFGALSEEEKKTLDKARDLL
ncbi:MAG: rhomboid family intramembrane serine protease [Opitutales bacterium]|jgi:membrane associated rhomboid family serine protease